jgi:lysophospholipase L1-like esterase
MKNVTFSKAIAGLIILSFLSLSFLNKREVKWIAIGDSITYLNDHPEETKFRMDKGYLTLVKEKLKNMSYINLGRNGWTTVGVAKAIDKLGIVKADIYTVLLGTNDWWAGLPVGSLADYKNNTGTGTTCGAYRRIIDKIRSLDANAKIVLITPMQRNDFVYIANPNNNAYGSYKEKRGQTLEMFADAIAAIGEYEKFPVVDLFNNKQLSIEKLVKFKRLKNPATGQYQNYAYPESTDIPFNPKTDEYPYPETASGITYDGLHPSNKGNEIIAKNLITVFKKITK